MGRIWRRTGAKPNRRDETLLLRELVKRKLATGKRAFNARDSFLFIQTLFRAQRDFFDDQSRLKAAQCSRRAGKSTTCAAILVDAAMSLPDVLVAYVANTRKQAKRIMWRALKRLNRIYGIGLLFNNTDLTATLRNGSQIILAGITNEKDIDRLRGDAFLVVVIDEAGTVPEDLMRELVRDVITPTMIDYDGTIILIGTPTADCAGLFYEATTGAPGPHTRGQPTPMHLFGEKGVGWSVHKWTLHDNPYVPHPKRRTKEIQTAAQWLARMRREMGISEADPSYQREFGNVWVRNASDIVYRDYSRERNVIELLPRLPKGLLWSYGVGCDLGYDDPTAIVLVQWCEDFSPDVFASKVIRRSSMIPAQIAYEILHIAPKGQALSFVVIDQGGGTGKMVAKEFEQRYKIPCFGAEKANKETYVNFVNGDFRTGRIKILGPECEPLLGELPKLQWEQKRRPNARTRKEDERFVNDCCDAFLYAIREARHYEYDPDAEPEELRPETGSEAAMERLADKLEDEVEERVKQQIKEEEEWWK